MKRILHVIDAGGPGGAETVFLDLVTGLDADRWRSFVAVPDQGWTYQKLVGSGFDPIITPLHGAFDVRYLAGLCKAVRKHKIDLIQTHLFTAGVYGAVAGRLYGVPVICTLHGQTDLSASGKYRVAKLWIMRSGVARVVCVSESLRRFVLSFGHLDPRRTMVIFDGIDASVFVPRRDRSLRAELGIGDDEVVVGAVGNVRPAKCYEVLLRAAALLRQQSKRYRFVVVGDVRGSLYQELLVLRRELNLDTTVLFAGFRDPINHVINNFDVYLSTSSSEGFSLSLVQAMACGVPVVATRSGGPEEIVTHDVDGLLVDAHAPEPLARAIERLSDEPATRERLTAAGRKVVETRFTLKSMVDKYDRLYQTVLHGRDAVPTASREPRERLPESERGFGVRPGRHDFRRGLRSGNAESVDGRI